MLPYAQCGLKNEWWLEIKSLRSSWFSHFTIHSFLFLLVFRGNFWETQLLDSWPTGVTSCHSPCDREKITTLTFVLTEIVPGPAYPWSRNTPTQMWCLILQNDIKPTHHLYNSQLERCCGGVFGGRVCVANQSQFTQYWYKSFGDSLWDRISHEC